MVIKLKIADDTNSEEWDDLVEASPHGTLFHTWKFLKIVEKHTSSKLYPLIGMKGTTPIGVYPLFLQRKHSIKLVLSPPSGALLLYLGPALLDYDRLKQSKKESTFVDFQKKIDEFLQSEIGYNYARIRTIPGLIDSRPFLWTNYKVEPLYTYMLDLDKPPDEIWKTFNKQVRMEINKTIKQGVKVKEGSEEDLEVLRQSVFNRFIEQGLKSRDYSAYLRDIYESFYPKNFRVFVGNYKEEVIGGLTLICYKDKVSLWMGVPKTDLKGIYPNDLVMWESIKWAYENGFKKYEIMDSGDDPRLKRFKSKFNPELCFWYSAEKYSSPAYKMMESGFRLYQKVKVG